MDFLMANFDWQSHQVRSSELPDAQALNRRAIDRLGKNDVAGALADFNEAVALKPDYAEAWNNSGLVKHTIGKPAEAVPDFDRALAVRPDYPEALTNRGRARQALGDLDGAAADYDRALECAADAFAASILHNRGALRQERGDVAGALADYDRALEINPDHTATYVNRGLARKAAGDLDGALVDFNTALEKVGPQGRGKVLHGRAGVRVLQNDFASAIADYDEALALEPDNYLYYLSRGHARYHKREARGVVDYLMAFRLSAEGTARDFIRLLREDAGRDAEAVLDNCAKHVRINDRDAIAYARRGFTLMLLGREPEAAADLDRLVELLPAARALLPRMIALARN